MWLIFAIIGMLLDSTSGLLFGALVGALLGHLLKQVGDLKRQVGALEKQVGYLREVVEDEHATRQPVLKPHAASIHDTSVTHLPEPEPRVETAEAKAEPLPVERVESEQEFEPAAPYASTGIDMDSPRMTVRVPDLGDWVSRLLAGNLLAKLGIVLLFFGAASGLKLAADYGLFPPVMRLASAALVGLLFIWAGAGPATGGAFRPAWLFRATDMSFRARSGFGFALEGGGFGLLYLATYFALSHFHFIEPGAAFILFAGLGVACVTLALRQEGQALALLGLSGAFLAPPLAGGEGRHLVLFGYIVLLDAFILWASLRRGWRGLILAGFIFSVLLGLGWAADGYLPELRTDTEIFVIILLLMFSLAPVLAALRGAGVAKGWQSATLLFGPPAVAAMVQSGLYHGDLDALALSSLLAGLWYGALWHLSRRGSDELLPRALAGLSLTFLSLAPFLAFSQNTASVFWALEGAGLVWYARRTERVMPMAAGVLLQGLSGLMLLDLWSLGPDGVPFRNSLFHASILLVVAGGLSSFALRNVVLASRLFLAWTLIWWFGIWYWELGYTLDDSRRLVAMLLLASTTFLATEWGGRRFGMPDLRAVSVLLLPLSAIVPLAISLERGHPLGDGLWLVLPFSLFVLYSTLRRQEQEQPDWFIPQRHVLQYWSVAWIPAWEVYWLAGRIPDLGNAIPEAARAVLLAAPLLVAGYRGPAWPLGPHRRLYHTYGLALPALLAWL